MWQRYGQGIVAALIAVGTLLASFLTDDRITSGEWVQLAIATTGALTVYVAPNLDRWPWVKSALVAIAAGLNVLVSVIDGGLTSGEVVNIVIAGVGTLIAVVAPAQETRTSSVQVQRPPSV